MQLIETRIPSASKWFEKISFFEYKLNESDRNLLNELIPADMDSFTFDSLEDSDFKTYSKTIDLLDRLLESLGGEQRKFVLGTGTEEGTPLKLISKYYSGTKEDYILDGLQPLVVYSCEYEPDGIVKGFALYPNHRIVRTEGIPKP